MLYRREIIITLRKKREKSQKRRKNVEKKRTIYIKMIRI